MKNKVYFHQRQEIYTKIFSLLLSHLSNEMPVNIMKIVEASNISCISLSNIINKTNLSPKDIFAIWGNDDGHLILFDGTPKIAFNDLQPETRIRFTLVEEISHYVLGHIDNSMYSLYDREIEKDIYAQHEEEARFAAGLILAPPPFYLEAPLLLNTSSIMSYSFVSKGCAIHCLHTLQLYKNEIINHPLYRDLSDIYCTSTNI